MITEAQRKAAIEAIADALECAGSPRAERDARVVWDNLTHPRDVAGNLIRAQAWDKGFAEGVIDQALYEKTGNPNPNRLNPYRADQLGKS